MKALAQITVEHEYEPAPDAAARLDDVVRILLDEEASERHGGKAA